MSTFTQRNFAAGEIGPSLYSRVDTTRYASGARTVRNMIVMRHGGLTNRPGSVFVGEVKDSSKTVRLIPFVFDATTSYVLEFGHLYFRVIHEGSYLTATPQAITAITNANPCVVTYTGADTYANGDEVYISGIVGPIGNYLNGRNFKVANLNAGANTFSLTYMNGTAVNSTAFGAYTSGGTVAEIYTLASIYQEADLPDVTIAQSADILEMTHATRGTQRVARLTSTTWDPAYTPTYGITAPSSISVTGAAAAGTYDDTAYLVIDVDNVTGEEGAGKLSLTKAKPTGAAAHTVTWVSTASNATSYVYRSYLSVYGLLGLSNSQTFYDDGSVTPDFTQRPSFIQSKYELALASYPAAVTYFQQRFFQAGGTSNPETILSSRSGLYYNYIIHPTPLDSDPLKFVINSRIVQQIKHMIDVGKLLILTATGEWSVDGNANGILTPSATFPKQHSSFGCSSLAPIAINGSVLFVQARGSIIRDLGFDFQIDGYRGNDLTVFSPHLVDNHTISDWAHQLTPHSVVWMARDDGTMLGMTYVKEQEIIGWHRHDFTGGEVENVCSVPEGDEDAVYVVIKRTINGGTKRYVERMASRRISDITDAIFMDGTLSYDGTNAGSTTMTLSGGTLWTYGETLTLTASAGFFTSADVGNAIHLTGSDGSLIRFTINHYTSTTVVTGHAHKTVPSALQSHATLVWTKAVDTVSGLWHLEGEDVSVFADGFVVANPNNAKYSVLTVTHGAITLDRPYGIIRVGLPFISDVETLNLDTSQGETVADKKKLITKVSMLVEASRGIWIGAKPPSDDDDDPLENLRELKIRRSEDYDSPVSLTTDEVSVDIKSEWNSNGRVFIRQIDPLPLSILSISPTGLVPFRGG